MKSSDAVTDGPNWLLVWTGNVVIGNRPRLPRP
jgi:hypothetical protein